ncbi:ABC-type metal ion transport system, ATPase component [Pantoea sp. GM01]|nr:ABC-type metal ion transport system, ATPase component [Pantoea sp. GM01]
MVKELLAQPDSVLGQRLFPLTPQAGDAELILQLSYRTDVAVASDWISRLSQQLGLRIDLLGAHVEQVNGLQAGRLQVGIHFQHERVPVARLLAQLEQLGLIASVSGSVLPLREAV